MIVLCPSYRRPQQAQELLQSFNQTKSLPETELLFAIGIKDSAAYAELPVIVYPEWPMTQRTNRALTTVNSNYIAWVADDNRFETPGWDEQVLHALQEVPMVFCNDVVSPGSKPSHVFMDMRIPKALGWLIHPEMRSTFFDDCWHDIGKAVGIRYLPNVRVNHLYTEKDNHLDFQHDMDVYQRWLRHDLDTDLARVRRALRLRRLPRGSERVASGSAA